MSNKVVESDTGYRYVGDRQTCPTVREMKRVRISNPTLPATNPKQEEKK